MTPQLKNLWNLASMSLLQKLKCKLGMHGPNWYGNIPSKSCYMDYGFQRRCTYCGAEWHGSETIRGNMRVHDIWVRVK